MKAVKTRRGVRLVHAGHVVSEVLSAPGPTHSVFDVLAACAFLGPSERLALLGFAGGGILAPLKAIGFTGEVDAVDLSKHGLGAFHRYVEPWAGGVRFHQAEASAWLKASHDRFGAIVEDLSLQLPGEVTKPKVSLTELPKRIARRLTRKGWAVLNALPMEGLQFSAVLREMGRPFRDVRLVHVPGYENKVLVGARELPSAEALGEEVRTLLALMGSKLAPGTHATLLGPNRSTVYFSQTGSHSRSGAAVTRPTAGG